MRTAKTLLNAVLVAVHAGVGSRHRSKILCRRFQARGPVVTSFRFGWLLCSNVCSFFMWMSSPLPGETVLRPLPA